MMFLSSVCYHTYSVVITYVRGSETWREYWQLTRPRWTARETKMVWLELHDAIVSNDCDKAMARVYECEVDKLPLYSSCCFVMRISSVVSCSVSDCINGDIVRKWNLMR